jgi:glycosyltransferase involved in cell wall biosynthesis
MLDREFRALGHDVTVVAFTHMRPRPSGIRHGIFFLKCIRNLLRADVAIIIDTFSAAFPAVLASRIIRRKSILRLGGDFLWESYVERTKEKVLLEDFYRLNLGRLNFKEKVVYRLLRWTFRSASRVVFSTQWQRDIFRAPYGISDERTAIIENAYVPPGAEPVKAGNFLFFAPSRKIAMKNLDVLEDAARRAKRECPQLDLDIETSSYEQMLSRMGKARAVVIVSLSEISPNMILDAIHLGIPFILTRENGIKDRIAQVGVTVDPLDPKAIADAMVKMCETNFYEDQLRKLKAFGFVHTSREIASEFLAVAEMS